MRKLLLFVSFVVLSLSVIAQVPTITSFSPASAEVGASVTITGTNFDATPANNIVYFGSAKATVTAATTTSLTVTVPASSTHASISVNTNGLIALTKSFFRVTNSSISPRLITGSNFGNNIEFSSIAGVNGDNIILAGDFNNDGKVDLVKAGSNNVRVHLNVMSSTGSISTSAFNAGTLFSISGGAQTIAVNDINGDGKLDIVTGSSSGISVLVNTTSGGILSFASSLNISGNISSVRLADLNLDGKLDIAALNAGALSVYSNTSNGATVSFANAVQITLSATGFNGLDLADMNLDGKFDMIVSKSGTTNILTNNSTQGSLSFSSPISLSVGHSYVAAVDLDIDGDNDLFLYNKVVNNGFTSGTLSSADFTSYNNSNGNDGDNLGLSVADFNGDGYPEVVSGTNWDKMWVYVNAASGSVSASTFSGKWYPRQNLYCGSCGPGIGVDINGDNKVDAVSSYRDQSSFVITQNIMAPAPSITVAGTLSPISICLGTTSATQTLTVSGADLTANITATAPAGYEISLASGSGFASSITLTRSGTAVAATTIYLRLQGSASNNASGNIAFTSTGATTRNVATGTATVNGANNLGGSLSFNGNNQYLTVPNSSNFSPGTGDFTVEWFQYQQSTSNWPRPFSIGSTQLAVSIEGGSLYLWLGGTWIANAALTNYLNTWSHFAIVKSSSNIKVYKDGVAIINIANTSNIAFTGAFNIGAKDGSNAGESFNGYITNFRFSNAAIYTSNFTVSTSPLASSASTKLLLLASNSGSILTDSGPSALTLTNTASTVFNSATPFTSPISGNTLCIGSPLQLTHPTSGGTWSIPATTGLSISNTGVLTGSASTTASSVVVSYDYTINTCSFTDTKTITISSLNAGTATGNQTLCSSSTTLTAITLAGNTSGSSIQWQSSLDNVTFSNISNATSASLSPASVTATTYYRAAVTTATCGTLNSNVIIKGYNNSLNFDGTDDFVQAGAPLPIAANDNFTYEAWVRPTVIDSYRGFLGTHVPNGGRGPSMWVGPNGSLHTDSYSGSTRFDMLVDDFFTVNAWVHVAWVKNGTTYTIYKNGVQVTTATAPASVLLPNANFTIGKLDNFFAGTLDEVRIWNTARTAQEINDNISATLNGNETGLAAYYTFNQGVPGGSNTSINTVANLTSTPNLNGTLTAFAKSGNTSNFIDGFRVLLTAQPVAPTAVCLNASSNTISVTALGSGITYQWFTNTVNNTTNATAIANATTNSYTIPTNVAGTRFYYVVVTGSCSSSITSNIVSQVVNSSTFTTDVSNADQNLAFGGTATPLTVSSPGATAYQWYSSLTKPALLDGFSGRTGWTSSTGSIESVALGSGGSAHPAIAGPLLTFSYADGSSVFRDFNLDQTATTITFSAEYAETDRDNNKAGDVGRIQLQFYNANNTQVGTTVQSPEFTGTLTFQSVSLTNVAIPSGATKVRVIFFQVTETEYWAGNYGIAFRNPSVTTNVALNGTLITGATSATYTPSTATPGALYYYAVATGGCSTATSSLSGLITVGKATPTIGSMTAINKTFGDAAFTLTAPTSNATGAFTFASSNTAVATISGTTVTIVGAGTATITATQATDANYNAGSVSTTLTVAKATPTIGSMAAINKTFGDANFALTIPTSNSNGLFTFASSNTAVATITNNTVTIVGAGTITITATQATSANYLAGSVTTTLTVAKANPTIGSQQNITRAFGSSAITLVAPTSNSNGAFTYTISDASVATISGATLTPVGIGTATITATQAATANYNAGSITRILTVVKGTPTIGTFAAINKTFGDAAFTLTAPSSTSTGAFTYASSDASVATVSGSTVIIVGAGTANITATQAEDANFNAGNVTAVLTVAKAARTLSLFADINKTTTDAPFTLTAPTSSAGTGAITYSSSNTAVATVSGSTVTPVGIGTTTITATQAADANYLAASITATLTVILGDSDGDGVPDDVEVREGTDPNNPSSVKDSDGDGVPDFVEIGNGTNPSSPSDAIDSDGDGLSDYYEARNTAPTNISLSTATVNENNLAGAGIIDLTAIDANIGEVFTYTLVAGTGDTDNASFTINGSSLRAVAAFDFETKTSYSFRLKVTDKGGLSFEKEFTITVTNVNEAPTALALSNTSVLENAASGTTVGTLAGTDADAGDTHTYTLVTGTGSTDNASFTITGTTLSTAAVFNFEAKNSYAVRVRVTDAGGLSFERAFTITVIDVNEAPTLTAITDRRVYNVSTSQVVNLAGITAGPETAQTTTTSVSTSNPTAFSAINIVGTQIQFTLAAGIATPQDVVVTVRVRDNGGVANGGVDSVVRTFRLGIDPMPVAAASPNLITLGATAQLSATGANAVNYTWVAVGGTGIVGSGATINVRPAGTTTYAVVVTNSFGYQATVPVVLTVIVDYKLVPNNLVTPNGDGVNDRWIIPNIDMYPDNEVMVYDKAGRAVFAKRGYNNEWDGTVNGKKLKEDAYFYVIKFNKDGALPIRGYVSIVR
jgi:gliding motility-associated-like protein